MKFLKNLFSVPKGKKVTDADMKRVLVSSVCGILICMTCLISSTWAWYTVSVETGGFAIEVADAKLTLDVGGVQTAETHVILLPQQETQVQVTFSPEQQPDGLNSLPQRYIVMTVLDELQQRMGTYYIACAGDMTEVKLITDVTCTVYFTPAWQIPLNGKEFPAESFKLIEAPAETEATTDTTAAPTETTAPVATTEPVPAPSESAQQTPNETTAPKTEPTE